METWNIIISVIATVFGTGGLGAGLFFFKENKALKAADVQHAYVKEWKDLFHQKEAKCDKQEKMLEQKDAKIDELRHKLNNKRDENADLRIENERLKWIQCLTEPCKRRNPPHVYEDKPTKAKVKSCKQICLSDNPNNE